MRQFNRLFSWNSIRTRIVLTLVGLTLMLGFVALLQASYDLSRLLKRQLTDRGIAIARDLAARSSSPYQLNDVFSLYEMVNSSLLNNRDIRYIFLVGPIGEVRVSTFGYGTPPGLLGANQLENGQGSQVRSLRTTEGEVEDIALLMPQGGTIRVGMSVSNVRQQVLAYIGYLALLVGVATVAAAVVAVFLTSVLTRPLMRLAEATKAVGRGDLTRKVPVDATDELGDLARAFNTMTDDLVQSRNELVQRNTELQVIVSMAEHLDRQLASDRLLQTSLEKILQLTKLPMGWVCLKDSTGQLQMTAHSGIANLFGNKGGGASRADDCPCREVLEKRQAVWLSAPPRCTHLPQLAADNFHTHIILPLSAGTEVLGVLSVASPSRLDFDQALMRLVTSLGQQLGIALQNSRLYAEVRGKEEARGYLLSRLIVAQEEERRRIAREIHDEPAQALTHVIMQLDTVERRLPRDREAERLEMERARLTVREAMEALQRIMIELRPQALDELGFLPAIRWFAEQRLQEKNILLEMQVRGTPRPLGHQLETALFRVMQEAIINIYKHSQARRVSIQLEFTDTILRGIVADDGAGFEIGKVNRVSPEARGLGLLGMEERISSLGGKLAIVSVLGKGTQVKFDIPLPKEAVFNEEKNKSSSSRRPRASP